MIFWFKIFLYINKYRTKVKMVCYDGFGNLIDGQHPTWIGDFSVDGKADVLFYYSGDDNWWLGSYGVNNQLNWNLIGNTVGFGHGINDGRPFWIGDFNGDGKADVLFYYPGDDNWWLGSYGANNQLNWNLIGNTVGFGNLIGDPTWIGDFNGDGKADVLFYYPGDGNWWLGVLGSNNQLNWRLVTNTGRPYRALLGLHVKIVANPNTPINTMMTSMRQVFATANIRVDLESTETLNLAAGFLDIDVGQCMPGQTTNEQNQLFNNRNFVGANDIVVYFVRGVFQNGTNALNGCAAHPGGRPGAVISSGATQWTLAHEVCHVLGLNHVETGICPINRNPPQPQLCLSDRLMTCCGTATITNPPPDLTNTEVQQMLNSNLTVDC
jgi:hypothetical protein